MSSSNLGYDSNPGGTKLVIVQLTFLGLAWIVGLLRAYVKIFLIKKVTLDDWLMLTALLGYTAYGIIAVHGVATGGTGRHTKELSLEGIAIALRAWYLCEVIYVPTAALIRTSIAVFLLRLVVETWHVWTIRINLIIIWLISIVYFFICTFQCYPPSFFWEGPARVPGATGKCISPDAVPLSTIAHSVISAVSDWVLGLLPIAMLWHVQLNRRTKTGVGILLCMGVIAGIAIVVRIPFIRRIAISADFLFETTDIAVWSVFEPSLGIIAGSVATLRPLFKVFGVGINSTKKSTSAGVSKGSRPWQISPSAPKSGTNTTDKSYNNARGVRSGSISSEIELRPAGEGPGRSIADLSPTSIWDVETGGDQGWKARNGISVQRSIDVVAHRRSTMAADLSGSESSSIGDLPVQGGTKIDTLPRAHFR